MLSSLTLSNAIFLNFYRLKEKKCSSNHVLVLLLENSKLEKGRLIILLTFQNFSIASPGLLKKTYNRNECVSISNIRSYFNILSSRIPEVHVLESVLFNPVSTVEDFNRPRNLTKPRGMYFWQFFQTFYTNLASTLESTQGSRIYK